jgi:predicted TIM-barrel fold metal-dependent hydrolase
MNKVKNIFCHTATFLLILFPCILAAESSSSSAQRETGTADSSLCRRIKLAVDSIWLVDTHEHLITEEGRKKHYTTDLFYLMGNYFRYDLITAGMPEEEVEFVYDERQPVGDRWKVFQPWWEKTKNTGYGLCVRKSAHGLFGVDEINENTWEILNTALLKTNRDGWYRHVLKDKARVAVSIVDPLERFTELDNDYPDDYFLKVRRFDNFIKAGKRALREAEEQSGIPVRSFGDYLTAVDTVFAEAVTEEGIVGVKSGLAYSRSLYYEDVPGEIAESVFNRVFSGEDTVSADEYKKLQDFMMHHILRLASRYGLPVQIHTGMLAGNRNRNPIENTNARLLMNLFLKFRDVRFVIFHGSYPYMDELGYLAKIFPNVYIDMCWMEIISPAAAKQALEEWLFTVPANKIMAFGGDVGNSVEWVYGHAEMARKMVAEVLTEMVFKKYYSEEEAISIAHKLLHDNAWELFSIEQNGAHYQSRTKQE